MRRAFRSLTACSLLGIALGAGVSHAQPYPQKTIRFVVPAAAGGGTDIVARALSRKMAEDMGQSIVIDNRPGANGIIGADIAAKAPPDGYTVLVSVGDTWVINQFLYDKLQYEPLKSFEPVAKIAVVPIFVIASAKGPKTMQELIDKARARPGQVTYGFGVVSTQLIGETLKQALKLNMLGIAYKNSSGVAQGMLSDDVDFAVDGVTPLRGQILSGKFRVLANMGKSIVPGFETVPTLATIAGDPSIDAAVWLGMSVPKGTPPEIVERLSKAVADATNTQEFKDALGNAGLVPDYKPTAEFRAFLDAEARHWGPIIKSANIKPQ